MRVEKSVKLGKRVVKFVWRLERSNVLLCRAIARIGEVPQAEGFGKNQRCGLTNFSVYYLAEKPLRGCGSTPSALTSPFPYIAGDAATQRKTLLRFCVEESKKIGKTRRTLLRIPIDSRP